MCPIESLGWDETAPDALLTQSRACADPKQKGIVNAIPRMVEALMSPSSGYETKSIGVSWSRGEVTLWTCPALTGG